MNHSYCAFENTELAINQLISMLSVAIEKGVPLDMSEYESRACQRMRDSLVTLSDAMDDYDSAFADEDEFEEIDSGWKD